MKWFTGLSLILFGLFLSTLHSHAGVPLSKPPVSVYDCVDTGQPETWTRGITVCRAYDPDTKMNYIVFYSGYNATIVPTH